jgi:hypothetical protein
MTTRQRQMGALFATAFAVVLLAFPALAAKGGKTPNPNNGHGKVTAISATSITVTPKKGEAKTFTITPDTTITLDGQAVMAADDASLMGKHAHVKSKDGTTANKIVVKKHDKKGKGGKKQPIAPAPTL